MPPLLASAGPHDTPSHRQRLLPAATATSLIRQKNAIRSGRANSIPESQDGKLLNQTHFLKSCVALLSIFKTIFLPAHRGQAGVCMPRLAAPSAGSWPPQGRASVGEVAIT